MSSEQREVGFSATALRMLVQQARELADELTALEIFAEDGRYVVTTKWVLDTMEERFNAMFSIIEEHRPEQ